MNNKVLALNDKGQMTWCTCPPEMRGKGRCNHIDHQGENESVEEFVNRTALKENNTETPKFDEQEAIEAISYNFGISIVKSRQAFRDNEYSEEDIERSIDYYRLKDLPVNIRQSEFNKKWIKTENGYEKVILDANGNNLNEVILAIPNSDGDLITEKISDLIKNEDFRVRARVAKLGYALDTLINDKEWAVRSIVASQGYGLDKLIKDEHPSVRAEVARQGYGLHILIKDESKYVRDIAHEVDFKLYNINAKK